MPDLHPLTPLLAPRSVAIFGPQPEQSVFTTRKHAWLRLPGEMRAFALMPPTASPKG